MGTTFMQNNNSLYIQKLKEKNHLLIEICNYTVSKNFQITEDEMQHIHNYLLKREEQISLLSNIQKDIEKLNINKEQKNNPEIINIIAQNDELIKKIVKCDKINFQKFSRINDLIKDNIKSVKNIGKANKSYYGMYNSELLGSSFDSKS